MSRINRNRRRLLLGLPLLFAQAAFAQRMAETFQQVEDTLGGRVGVSLLDTHSGTRIAYRSTERFALCSTFKAPLAAAVLARIDAGALNRSGTINLVGEPLLSNSPVSSAHATQGEMALITACEAIVSHSDNTAANLLLRLIGGPEAMTLFFRDLGDDVTRLDRYEMALNSNIAGDLRDTTTPDGMLITLRAMVLGDALTASSRKLLTDWMLNEQRGKARIRAGLPNTWRVANKPGTSANGATNDIAVIWPPEREPVVMTIYINAPAATIGDREKSIAQIARAAAESL